MNQKYTPYLIGLGIFTLLFGIFAELAVHKINPDDFSIPYYSSIEETATTVITSETTVEYTTETEPETSKATTKAVTKVSKKRTKTANANTEQFRITVYTPSSDGGKWGYATSTGATSEHLKTCAVDPDVIPLGSIIEVNGIRLKAVDIGGGVKGNVIDIFYDGTSKEAREWINGFGEYHEVTIIEQEEYYG